MKNLIFLIIALFSLVFPFNSCSNNSEVTEPTNTKPLGIYYQDFTAGLDENDIYEIRKELAAQIQSSIDEYKLAQDPNLIENIHMYYEKGDDGYQYARAEYIAYVTDETTATFGCGDHAHLFASYCLEE